MLLQSVAKPVSFITSMCLVEEPNRGDCGDGGCVLSAVALARRDDPVTEISLKSYSNSRDVKTAVDKISQKGGLSNVGERSSCPDVRHTHAFVRRPECESGKRGDYHVFNHSSLTQSPLTRSHARMELCLNLLRDAAKLQPSYCKQWFSPGLTRTLGFTSPGGQLSNCKWCFSASLWRQILFIGLLYPCPKCCSLNQR